MWTIFKVFIEFVTILFLFSVLVFWPWGMWDLGSPVRARTCTPCIGRLLTTGPSGKSSVSCSVMSDSLPPHGLQLARLPCPSPLPWACSNSCPSSRWCHPTISSSAVPFSSCLQSFPASGSFPMSQFFTSCDWSFSFGVSASSSVLPMNIQDWFTLGWTGWISLQSKGFSRVFANTTIQKHKFFGINSLWSNSHIHTWLLEKP